MKSITINITPLEKEGAKAAMVSVEGDFTLKNAAEIKQQLMHIAENFDHVEVSLNHIVGLDLSGIQLLYAMDKTFTSQKKLLALNVTLSAELEALIKHAGFSDILQKGNQADN